MFRTVTDVTRTAPTEQDITYLARKYLCDFCSDGWTSETDVEIHRSNSHGADIADMVKSQDRSVCKMCVMEFPDQSSLLCHIKQDHLLSSKDATRVERDIFICSNCGDIFFNKLLLTYHILNSHMDKAKNPFLKCPRCFKKIRLRSCWYHFSRHKFHSVAVCKICLVKCIDRVTLAEHMRSHALTYKCDTCAYVTKKKELFEDHIQQIHRKPGLSIGACDDNWLKYYTPQKQLKAWPRMNLMGWKGVRLTNNVHICVLCREICVGKEDMKRHVLIDHMGEETRTDSYSCPCGLVFTSKVLYRYHMFKFKDVHKL